MPTISVNSQIAERPDIADQMEESLRRVVATLWDKVQLLEGMAQHLPTGDQAAILHVFQGDFDQIIETWQQSILSRLRETLTPDDGSPEFRSKVIERYSKPCAAAVADELAKPLDGDLANSYVTFWGLS